MQVPPNSDLTLGMVCVDKSVPGRCTWRMTADERFANPAGTMQGGFLGAFADSAMGAAAVTFAQARKVFCANAEMKISFLAPVPRDAVLTCTAEVVSGGTTVAFVEASIWAAAPEHGGPTAGAAGPTAGAAGPTAGAAGPTAAAGPANAAGDAAGPAGGERLVARANSTYIFRSRG
jgi:uncharacterized protein (TIGR00369 family)